MTHVRNTSLTVLMCALCASVPALGEPAQDAGTPTVPVVSQGVPLSAEQAIAAALDHNPNLRSVELGLESATEQVRAEHDRYPYSFVADAGYTRSESPQLRADDSMVASASRTLDTSVGIRRTFPFGGSAEVRALNQYFDRDTDAVTLSPFLPADSGHATTLRATASQPLLRGFGTRVGELDLRVAESNRTVAERGLVRSRSALVRDVLGAYYELWYAARAVEIERASLALVEQQEREASARVAAGALSPVELFSFQTRSAELEESVVSAELVRKQRSINLSRLMGSAGEPAAWEPSSDVQVGSPADRPTLPQVEAALADDSLELADLAERVRTAELRTDVAGEASRPRLDLEGYAQSHGISQSFGPAWQRAGELQHWSAHVGLSLELPLTDDRREAQARAARLEVLSARADLEAARADLRTSANLALESDTAARARLSAAERTLAIAEKSYEAAAARFELGQTTAITLQQAEDDLRRARLRVVRARVDVAQQRVTLQHITNRLVPR